MLTAAIVDSSVAAKWWLREPDRDSAYAMQGMRLEAPDLLHLEVMNALRHNSRAGLFAASAVQPALAQLAALNIRLHPFRNFLRAALDLALRLDHPVPDCIFVAVAQATGLPLVTTYTRLKRKAAVLRDVTILSLAEAVA